MTHALIAACVVAHGAVHAIMFGLALIPDVKSDMAQNGFRPSHSWLIGETPVAAFIAGLGVTLAFAIAGGAILWRANWWPAILLGAAGASLLLLALYASQYWVVGYLINIVLIVAAWRSLRSG